MPVPFSKGQPHSIVCKRGFCIFYEIKLHIQKHTLSLDIKKIIIHVDYSKV
jgi:hypothetical protein